MESVADIEKYIIEAFTKQPDARFSTDDQIRIAILLAEIDRLNSLLHSKGGK